MNTITHKTIYGEVRGVKAVRTWVEDIGWRGALREAVGEAMARTRLCGCCTPDWMDIPLSRRDDEASEGLDEDYYPVSVRSVLYSTFCRMTAMGPEVPGSARRLTRDEARDLDWWDEDDCGCEYGEPHTCR